MHPPARFIRQCDDLMLLNLCTCTLCLMTKRFFYYFLNFFFSAIVLFFVFSLIETCFEGWTTKLETVILQSHRLLILFFLFSTALYAFFSYSLSMFLHPPQFQPIQCSSALLVCCGTGRHRWWGCVPPVSVSACLSITALSCSSLLALLGVTPHHSLT